MRSVDWNDYYSEQDGQAIVVPLLIKEEVMAIHAVTSYRPE